VEAQWKQAEALRRAATEVAAPSARIEARLAEAEFPPEAAAVREAPPPSRSRRAGAGARSAHGHRVHGRFLRRLAAFEREQAAEAAAVEAYGDKIVSGTVIKQTEKHLVWMWA
jgi:small subunit ribosomal protein S1